MTCRRDLSVLTCKGVTREIPPFPGVVATTELIQGDEEQSSVFDFYIQSNNMGHLNLVSGFSEDRVNSRRRETTNPKILVLPGVLTTTEVINDYEDQGFPTIIELIHGAAR